MKKAILLLLMLFGAKSFAQDTINTAKAKDYINKEVWLKGTVAAVKLADEGATANYINIDKAFPNNVFTVIITTKYAERLKLKLDSLKGKKIMVKGTIMMNEREKSDVPQIFNPSIVQIK